MPWADLGDLAPRTKSVWEAVSAAHPTPVLDTVPSYLGLPQTVPTSADWSGVLNADAMTGAITNREVLLRYLLTRAVVDQGSDIDGVDMWHSEVLARCYAAQIPILHAPALLVDHYSTVLDIADDVRHEVVAARAEEWAGAARGRHAASYTPFNVDGQRGGKQAHWFLSARFFSALLLSQAEAGGLTAVVFGRANDETPAVMARRLRSDSRDGLGYTIGDKACDLFAKWSVGTFRLGTGLDVPWGAPDAPLPMDQRIGRLLMRCGFMDEFYGVARLMAAASNGFTPPIGQVRPPKSETEIPPGRWHLTVMNFRRHSRVKRPELLVWLKDEWVALDRPAAAPSWYPQEVVALLCRSLNSEVGSVLTPVELDDFFMGLGGSACVDVDPTCDTCPLATCCQANVDPARSGLKNLYT